MHKQIDYTGEGVLGSELLVRLLCSPLYYNTTTNQVNPDVFDLRMLGPKRDNKETYVSLIRKEKCIDEAEFYSVLEVGYDIWDKKSWENNSYYGYGTFVCQDALSVKDIIEIWPLVRSKEHHVGLFYAKSNDEYYEGPLPKDDPEILEMLVDLSDLIANSIEKAPERE